MVKIIREAQYEKLMKKVVEPGLAALREEIDMPLSTGGTLHCEIYNRYDAKKAVVIVHGYTECAEKFRFIKFIAAFWYVKNERMQGRIYRQRINKKQPRTDGCGAAVIFTCLFPR